MRHLAIAAALFAAFTGTAQAGKTLDAIKARGQLLCGVSTGVAGFASADSQGKWTGLDVDLCKAIAVAMFGDAEKVKFTPTTAQQRFVALQSGEVDVITRNATQTLLRNGGSRLQALAYGLLPQNAAELTSYTVYRWECAIRSSVVLGFVGAGGLGQQMDNSMKMFNGGEVATMLLVFMALVALADRTSAWLRKALG